MIRHVVFLTWKEGTTDEQIREVTDGLMALPETIPDIVRFTCGSNLGLTEGDWDYAIVGDFHDVEGWRRYQEHPTHVSLLEEVIGPITAGRSRVQFEI